MDLGANSLIFNNSSSQSNANNFTPSLKAFFISSDFFTVFPKEIFLALIPKSVQTFISLMLAQSKLEPSLFSNAIIFTLGLAFTA